MEIRKNFLFFFVHPSKYYLFRTTINTLKSKGHNVDVAIISKDVLEELIKNEGWEYINVFPEGRRSKKTNFISILWTTFINLIKTINRLNKIIKNKKYDLFITDDCLVFNGWLKKIKSIFFTDNELSTVPETAFFLMFCTKILAPASVYLGKYEHKKNGFDSYKELAYLHPDYFIPSEEVVKQFNPELKKYFVIRLVSMTASHDRFIKGISNKNLQYLINILEKKGQVYISSERELPDTFQKYCLKIKPNEISHVLSFAEMFIGDSGTMSSEAALLGTPTIMIHDFVDRLKVMQEKENKYKLMFCFKNAQFDEMCKKIEELLEIENIKIEWKKRQENMLLEKEDVNTFIIKMIEKI